MKTDVSEIGIGVCHEVAITGCGVGWKSKDFADFSHDRSKMELVLGVLRGTHEIKPIDHMIDVSLSSELPFDGAKREVQFVIFGDTIWKLEKRGEDLYVNDRKIGLYYSEQQLNGKTIEGHELRTEIDGKPEAKLPAVLLDYLVEHPTLWPEYWKKDEGGNTIYIYFWGDIFRLSNGRLFVRCGYWCVGQVLSHCHWLGRHWDGSDPAGSFVS